VHVVAPAPFGGLESVVLALSAAAQRRGDAVTVAVLLQDREPHRFVAAARAEGVAVTELRCGRRRYLREVRALAGVFRGVGATVVHTHNYHADLVGLLAARLCRLPVVTTVHGFDGGDLKARAYEALDRWLLRWFDAVIGVSERTGAEAREAVGGRAPVRVVPNGYAPGVILPRLAARERLGLPPDARVVGWAGRMWEVKGPDLLVEAAALLEVPGALVVMIGDGPERATVEAICAARGLDQVRLLGARDDVAQLMSAFDVLALSSRSEGTPMVLLEAMAAGVPVVSFAVGGIPDVVSESSAWLVPPGDVAALARALHDALTLPAEAGARASAARRVLDERFGLEPWLGRIDAVYAEIARR
jgi:glycosyltransferase involved in cell wall biosynthesis